MVGIGIAPSGEGMMTALDLTIVVVTAGDPTAAEGLVSVEGTTIVVVGMGLRMGPGEVAIDHHRLVMPRLRDHASSCNRAANQLLVARTLTL